MKIKTQVAATVGGMVIMLIAVSFGGYMAATIVNKAGSVIPAVLVPGIQNYNDLRYKTLEIAMHGYQGEIDHAAEMAEPLIPRIESFSTVAPDSPFFGDKILEEGVAYIGGLLLNVVDETLALEPGGELSPEFLAAVEEMEGMDERANEVIQHLIDATTSTINNVIGNIIKGMMILGVVVVLIAIGIGYLLTRKLNHGLTNLQESFRLISGGDLTVIADDSKTDELGEIAGYFNGLASSLKDTIGQLANMMNTLAELSARFKESGVSFQERAQQTSDETNQVATAMTEMAATVREVAQNAEATSTQASDASREADSARGLVTQTVTNSQQLKEKMGGISDQIGQLKDKTESISSVIDVIQGIAEQTNLLALNAAIEAARAGEQGRGFAVVADEVRSLATRTGQSTQEIVDVIQALQGMSETTAAQISEGQESVERNAESITNIEASLTSILNSISTISDMNHQIATNSQEQSHVAEDMNTNVVRISDLSEQNAMQTEKINQDIHTIDELTQNVRDLISKFQY
jgi:methyl-accepting chemotaxis protein